MSKKIITPAATFVGAALVAGLSPVNLANAADNPFAVRSLDSGYTLLAGAGADKGTSEGKCGEGKCGEGKCGSKSGGEGKCGSKSGGEDKGGAG